MLNAIISSSRNSRELIFLSSIAIDTPFKEIVSQWTYPFLNISIGCTPIPSSDIGKKIVDALGIIEYALYGLAADYAFVDYQSDTPPCGTNGCAFFEPNHKGTATFCGHCIDVSDLGNIMFGLGGAARGYNLPFTFVSASSYNVLADWAPTVNWKKINWNDLTGLSKAFLSPDGRAAVIGWSAARTGTFLSQSSFCTMYSAERWITGGYENGEAVSQCTTCSREYSPQVPEPSSLWRISGKFGLKDPEGTKNTIQQLQERIYQALGLN